MRAGELMRERQAELAEILIRETGKTRARREQRSVVVAGSVHRIGRGSKRIHGETVCFPVPWLDTRTCYTRREPIGVVAAITPFNFPLNLAVHKLAPALAAGNAVILKPAEATSVIGYKLCEILIDAGAPKGFVSCLLGQGQYIGDYLTQNPDIGFYSFTGSVPVGKKIKESIGLRRCALELGSNSATIVCKDYDIEQAVAACADAAFYNAGQVCISLQRIYVDRAIFDAFLKRLVEVSKENVCGDPSDPKTQIGPMISIRDAERAMEWIAEAEKSGAKVHCGNKREGSVVWPTVLTNVTRDMKVTKDETFAPIVSVVPFDTMKKLRHGQRFALRPELRHTDQRPVRGHGGNPEAQDGRRHRWRHLRVPFRQHALRRYQGKRHRPRSAQIRHRGNDRDEDRRHTQLTPC
jgi:acyl-CoA reductase-like NAD-dependent aldehyde dehydrogenase